VPNGCSREEIRGVIQPIQSRKVFGVNRVIAAIPIQVRVATGSVYRVVGVYLLVCRIARTVSVASLYDEPSIIVITSGLISDNARLQASTKLCPIASTRQIPSFRVQQL